MFPFFKRSKPKVTVIGLDGVPYTLLRRFAADGTMPFVSRLAGQGHLSPMQVTLPEISAVSWTSFMTGANPGVHGIFGFTDLVPGGKDQRFPNFRDVKAPTFWDRLGQKGRKCVVINQPATYPARPIPGILVSGFVALDLRKACFPARYFPDLKRLGYELDIDTRRARSDHAYLMHALRSSLEGRRKAVDLFWDEDWDYFQVVVTGTDRLQHYLWRAIEDRSHPLHGEVLDYYRRVDSFVEEVVGRHLKKTGRGQGETELPSGLFLLSDHGFTGIVKEFYLNAWLRGENYQEDNPQFPIRNSQSAIPNPQFLDMDTHAATPRKTLHDLSPSTRVFALDPNRLYFNRRDRFADGCVEAKDIPALVSEITAKLLALRHDGKPVVQRVLTRDEAFSGPQASHGPDLIALTHYGFDAKGSLDRREAFADTDLQGMHTWDDAFFLSADASPPHLNIVDLAGLMEAALG